MHKVVYQKRSHIYIVKSNDEKNSRVAEEIEDAAIFHRFPGDMIDTGEDRFPREGKYFHICLVEVNWNIHQTSGQCATY